jgi:hypothetical protein
MRIRLLAAGIVIAGATLAPAAAADDPMVWVRQKGDGAYIVVARFSVAEPPDVARDVLTDYANIPRFMPGVRTSDVVERRDGYARVEQEAVSTFLLFSKRVHLVLDVDEGTTVIRFRDSCNKSFVRYEGAWTLTEHGGETDIAYELITEPAFSVPEFVLRKLLNRDARVMIDSLRAEIASRATATAR